MQTGNNPIEEPYCSTSTTSWICSESALHERSAQEAEDERDALIKSVESIPAPKEGALSKLEWQILCIDRQNPHEPGTGRYNTHELEQAKHVMRQEAGDELVNELLNAMADRWRTRAAILKGQFPGADISIPPNGTVDGTRFPANVRYVHKAWPPCACCTLDGTSSDISRAATTIALGLDRAPWVFENPLTSFMFVTLMRDIHGPVMPFRPSAHVPRPSRRCCATPRTCSRAS